MTRLVLPRRTVLGGLLAGALASPSLVSAASGQRILSIGGVVTEILFALDTGASLIGRDTSSTYPAAALDLPDVGYMRMLAAEGVIALRPDLILALEGSGPPPVLALIKASGISVTMIEDGHGRDAIGTKIRRVGEAIGAKAAAEVLAERARRDYVQVAERVVRDGTRPRILFCLSAAAGRVMVAGAETAAETLIIDAGGTNAASGFDGYKPMNDEAILAAAPDLVLVMERPGGVDPASLARLPVFAGTPAGRAGAIVGIDGLESLGYGPRAAGALAQLAEHVRRIGNRHG